MKLSDYLTKHSISKADFAAMLSVTPALIYQWTTDKRPVAPHQCVTIEQLTQGEVGRKDLLPDTWESIWPELAATHHDEAA